MTKLLEKTYIRTLSSLVERFATPAHRGFSVEAWLFEDAPNRRRAEAELAAYGVKARFRSTYKPLLHFFLEELGPVVADLAAIEVLYPVAADVGENRFLLETYPLAALYGDISTTFAKGSREQYVYDLRLKNKQGEERMHQVFAPNRVHQDQIGQTNLSPTGWLRVQDQGGNLICDERLATDLETLFAEAIQVIATHPWGAKEPYFEELNITAYLPGGDRGLGFGEESISLHEALHEDLYFSLLEVFLKRSNRPPGDRGLQPGQIVPEVRSDDGPPRVTVETRPLARGEITGPSQELERAVSPLTREQISAELQKIGGTPFSAGTRAGRRVEAIYHPGRDLPVMISGGQHANETTGVVGALRAAKILAERSDSHFAVTPLENPDGYALHQRLIQDNPRHMHHAARYTALGDDLGHRHNAFYEADIRCQSQQLSQAQLHINLHGYPSHEWTRPLSGYVPRGFALWTLPKGFFLIVNHHRSWEDRALALVQQVAKELAKLPGLLAFNQAQIDLYGKHVETTGFRIIEGFPCLITADDHQYVPLVLMTEYPDETCYDASFIAGHTAQMATVLAAYEAYQG